VDVDALMGQGQPRQPSNGESKPARRASREHGTVMASRPAAPALDRASASTLTPPTDESLSHASGMAISPLERASDPDVGVAEPKVILGPDLNAAADQAWARLAARNDPPRLFLYAGVPHRRVEERDALEVLTVDRLRWEVEESGCRWRRSGRTDTEPPPPMLAKNMLATPVGKIPLPPLLRFASAPFFAADGTLVCEPGYHVNAKVFLLPIAGVHRGDIPDSPEPKHVKSAKRGILDWMLVDFPFANQSDRAHAVALLLLPYVRPMIKGPTPLHSIQAPKNNCGKTLLATVLTRPFLGDREPASMSQRGRDDEWRKTITAKLRNAPSHLFIDNVKSKVTSGALAHALTAELWEDRLLGASIMGQFEITNVWIMTANRPRFDDELKRRRVRIALERPEGERTFKIKDLKPWVRKRSGRISKAALILIQAWIAQGKPEGHRILDSFEHWSRVMGGILDVAGIPGFLDEEDGDGDPDVQGWKSFLRDWWKEHRLRDVTTGELLRVWQRLKKRPCRLAGESPEVSLAKHLDAQVGRCFGRWTIGKSRGKNRKNQTLWYLERAVDGAGSAARP